MGSGNITPYALTPVQKAVLETTYISKEQKNVVKATEVTKISIYNAIYLWLALE